jgi:hypothetical protein
MCQGVSHFAPHTHMQGTPGQPASTASQHPSHNNLLIILELKMAGAAGSNCTTLHSSNLATTSSLKDKPCAHFGTDEDDAERVEQLLAGAVGLVCLAYHPSYLQSLCLL